MKAFCSGSYLFEGKCKPRQSGGLERCWSVEQGKMTRMIDSDVSDDDGGW